MNLFEFMKKFNTEEKAIMYFIELRYKEDRACPHCGGNKVSHRKDNIKFFQCNACNNSFSVFKGTIFEKSDTDFRKWLFAINLFLNSKKGISGYQLMRELGVTYKTAWRMLKQIRTAIGNVGNREFIDAIIEMDETYVGGKPRIGSNPIDKKDDDSDDLPRPNKRGRGTKKTPVIGAIDRISKQIHAKVALPNKDGKALTGKQLMNVLDEVCKTSSIIVTDGCTGYNILRTTNHVHFKIDHNKLYAEGDTHTNNIESFWATLKRGILGIYHKVSVKYLQDYVNEFCFRYNNRSVNMFDLVLTQSIIS